MNEEQDIYSFWSIHAASHAYHLFPRYTLVYLYSGQLHLRNQCGEALSIVRGDCAFIGRDSYSQDVYKRQLFESVVPYFDAGEKPSEDILKLKMIEGVYVLLNTDRNLYASLFDFVEPWKIDILDYLNENYMCDPVSYTHLDVYKRQLSSSTRPSSRPP